MPGLSKLNVAYQITKVLANPASSRNDHWEVYKSFKELGPIFRIKTPVLDIVWLKDLESIERLFRQDAKYPARIMIPSWQEWRDLNKAAQGIITV
jgi:hypothetical protein